MGIYKNLYKMDKSFTYLHDTIKSLFLNYLLIFWHFDVVSFFYILSKLFSLHVTNYMGPYHDIFVKLSIKVT